MSRLDLSLVVAMGFAEDGWRSSQIHTDSLFAALDRTGTARGLGLVPKRFVPRLGRVPGFWDRRVAYPKLLPAGRILQLMDQSYGDVLLSAKPRFHGSVALIHDTAFWKERNFLNWPVRRRILAGLAAADRRVTVSAFTAAEVRALGLKVDAVIAPGFDLTRFVHSGAPRDPGLLLHVGTVVPRKAPDRLLRLLAALPDHRLLQLGGSWDEGSRRLIAELGLAGRITQRPDASPEEIAAAYHRASLLVFPSRYEGFGMPVVEARLCGTPVAISAQVPAAEMLKGDPATLVVDFDRPDLGALRSLRPASLAERERFCWDRAAREYGEIYRELMRA